LPDSKEKENLQENIESIREQSCYIDKIVEDLHDLARPLKPEISTVDASVFINKLLENIPIPGNIETSVEIEDDVSKLKLDPIFLRRIMTNLIINGVQAMPKGGKLFIKGFRKNGEVLITVEDTGMGISENIKSKLFTPLVTTKSKGQGFGLPVVKRLVEAHGGRITFESQEGKGTKFVIELPLY